MGWVERSHGLLAGRLHAVRAIALDDDRAGGIAIVLASYMFLGDRFGAPDRTPGIEQPAPKTN
jgi:hypothetical protein